MLLELLKFPNLFDGLILYKLILSNYQNNRSLKKKL